MIPTLIGSLLAASGLGFDDSRKFGVLITHPLLMPPVVSAARECSQHTCSHFGPTFGCQAGPARQNRFVLWKCSGWIFAPRFAQQEDVRTNLLSCHRLHFTVSGKVIAVEREVRWLSWHGSPHCNYTSSRPPTIRRYAFAPSRFAPVGSISRSLCLISEKRADTA